MPRGRKPVYDRTEVRVKVFDLLAFQHRTQTPAGNRWTLAELVEELGLPTQVVRQALTELKVASAKHHDTGYTVTYATAAGKRYEWFLTNVRADVAPAWRTLVRSHLSQMQTMLGQQRALLGGMDGRTSEARVLRAFEMDTRHSVERLEAMVSELAS